MTIGRTIRRKERSERARGASLRDDSVAQSADSQVSCKCTQNRCPTGSRGRARRDATSRSIDHAHTAACINGARPMHAFAIARTILVTRGSS